MNISMSSTGLLTVNSTEIEEVSEFKLSGKTVDRHMSFAAHVENIFQKSKWKLHVFFVLKHHSVSTEGLIRFYQANNQSGINAAPTEYGMTD